jgi:conjugal transfer/entry exclusion protein
MAFGFLLCVSGLKAQVLGTGITPTVQMQDNDFLSIQERITSVNGTLQAGIDRAEQITSAMNTLLTLNQSLQYQIKAAQALAEGSWDGFVDYFNYQTQAVSGFTASILDVNEITGAFSKYDPETGTFARAFDSAGYEQLKQHAVNINRSMAAANDMVRSTDSLVDQTERNYMLIERGINNTANATNALQVLQGQAQILAAIGSESAAASQLMYTQQRFLQTFIQNMQETNALNEQLLQEFTAPPSSPYNKDDPFVTPPRIKRNMKDSLSGHYLDVEVPNWP